MTMTRVLARRIADPSPQRRALLELALSESGESVAAESAPVHGDSPTETLPKVANLHRLFERQVERTPDGVAIVFEQQELRYRELDRKANQLAHHLQDLGVGPDTLVGLCVAPSLEMVVGILGILKAGGAYVPLDHSHPGERLAFVLEDENVSACICGVHTVDQVKENFSASWTKLSPQRRDQITMCEPNRYLLCGDHAWLEEGWLRA